MTSEVTREAVGLLRAKELVVEIDITQDEIAVRAKREARINNLHRARKMSRANVSKFFANQLKPGHARDAIEIVIKDLLNVEIDYSVDDA